MASERETFFSLNGGSISTEDEKNIKSINRWKCSKKNNINLNPNTGSVEIKESGEYEIEYDVSYRVAGCPIELTVKDILPCFSGEFGGFTGIPSNSSLGLTVLPGGSLTFCNSTYNIIEGVAMLVMNGDLGFGYFNSTVENSADGTIDVITASFNATNFTSSNVIAILNSNTDVSFEQDTVNIAFSGFISGNQSGFVSGTGVLNIYNSTDRTLSDSKVFYSITPILPVVMNLPVKLPFKHVRTYKPSIALVKNDSLVLNETPLASVEIPKTEIVKSLLYTLYLTVYNFIGSSVNQMFDNFIAYLASLLPLFAILPVPTSICIPTLYGIIDNGEVSFSNVYKLESCDKLRLLYNQTPPCESNICLSSPLDLETVVRGTALSGFKLD